MLATDGAAKEHRKISEALGMAVLFAAGTAGLFLAAGSFGFWRGWAFLGVTAAGLLGQGLYVGRKNPELRRQRDKIGANTPRWDLRWVTVFWSLMLGGIAFSAYDAGRAPERAMPAALGAVGVALYGLGMTFSAWAMSVNRFFEGTVRLQQDRGQVVIDQGPYRWLRHPGYLGLCLWALAIPFLLGSWRGLIVAAVTVFWIAGRTFKEDRLLQGGLAGYREYAQRVRFRLLPGIW